MSVPSSAFFSFLSIAVLGRLLRRRPRRQVMKSCAAFSAKVRLIARRSRAVGAAESRRHFRAGACANQSRGENAQHLVEKIWLKARRQRSSYFFRNCRLAARLVRGAASSSSAEADVRSGFKRHELLGSACSKVEWENVGLGVPLLRVRGASRVTRNWLSKQTKPQARLLDVTQTRLRAPTRGVPTR